MQIKLKNESVNTFLDRVHLSKKKIYELKTNKKIDVANFDEVINGYINIDTSEEINYHPEEYNLDIIYEDDNYLVVNKKSGIIIHD